MRKGQSGNEVRHQLRGTGLSWTLVIAMVMAVAIVIGIIQNAQGVRLHYLGWHGSVSLIAVLLATVVLTVAVTSLVGVIWRRRRRHQLTESSELHELREQAHAERQQGAPAGADLVGAHNPRGAQR
ncbi:MAG: LapA family protein [Candidatus Dormibacteria bacterium]|jgi:uncharacterized integral membrane protein